MVLFLIQTEKNRRKGEFMNKKLVMSIALAVGIIMLVGTAFADVMTKTGYVQAKDAAKSTAAALDGGFKSVTATAKMTVKFDGKIMATAISTNKLDIKAGVSEVTSTQTVGDKSIINYKYGDKDISIFKDSISDVYYLTEYPGGTNNFDFFKDPFKMKEAADVERIFDALVGNMKDFVVANDMGNGNTEISASISEGQIPSLINAVTSFGFKQISNQMNRGQGFTGDELVDTIKNMKSDIFVKNASGKMTVNKDGIVIKATGSGTLSGKDDAGNEHDLSAEVLLQLKDIDSTVVEKPNLEGKKVQKNEPVKMEAGITEKFAGTYKSDIIEDNGDSFKKIGERVVVIAHVDGKTIEGRYYETFKDADKNKDAKNFTFAINRNEPSPTTGDPYGVSFQRDDKDLGKVTYWIYFDRMGQLINLSADKTSENRSINTQYIRVFE